MTAEPEPVPHGPAVLRGYCRDYERLPQHSETMITWAAITLMSRRLTRKAGKIIIQGGDLLIPAPQVAGLAVEGFAECGEGGEADGLGTAIFQHGQVGGCDFDAFGRFAHDIFRLGMTSMST